MQRAVEFHRPAAYRHSQMQGLGAFSIHRFGQRHQQSLGAFIAIRIEEEIHITAVTPKRPDIAPGYPLPLHQGRSDARLLHLFKEPGDEPVHIGIELLQREYLLHEGDSNLPGHLQIFHVFQTRRHQTCDTLPLGNPKHVRKSHPFKRQKPDTLFPEAGSQQREESVNGFVRRLHA